MHTCTSCLDAGWLHYQGQFATGPCAHERLFGREQVYNIKAGMYPGANTAISGFIQQRTRVVIAKTSSQGRGVLRKTKQSMIELGRKPSSFGEWNALQDAFHSVNLTVYNVLCVCVLSDQKQGGISFSRYILACDHTEF